MGNTLCGSVVVIAIPNAHTQDDATDSLSLRSFYGKNYVLLYLGRNAGHKAHVLGAKVIGATQSELVELNTTGTDAI